MTDDEFRALLYDKGALFDAMWEIEEDHRTQDIPAHTALFTRTFPTYTETMWVHGYPSARIIVVSYPAVTTETMSMPGNIRTIPVGWRDMASAKDFRNRFDRTILSLAESGWKRKSEEVRG